MKKFLGAFALFLLGSLIFTTYAADGSSGCGLGWQVFQKNTLVSSSLRATTNTITLNSIGMTLGTSGCTKHDIVQNEARGMHFAEANHHQLMLDMAQGEGEFVVSFAAVLGCQGDSFAAAVQKNYKHIFTSAETNAAEMYQNLKKIVVSDQDLARACAII